MTPTSEFTLDQAVAGLKTEVGANLYSLCLYGSAVRGNAIEGVSDLNLLIVLNESSSAAHQAVARALDPLPRIDPFVLAIRGFERSVRAFATKFASIRRHYRVLDGADPLAGLKFDPQQERFLCEQALRNLRLRLAYSFVTRHQHGSYDRFVVRNVTAIFVHFSEVLRLEEQSIPSDFAARIPILQREFEIDGQTLRDLLQLKRAPHRWSAEETIQWHDRLFPMVDTVVRWVEERWPA